MKQQSTFSVRSSHKFVDPSGKSSYVSNSIEAAPLKKSGAAPQKGMAVRNGGQPPVAASSSVTHGSQKGMAVRTSSQAMPDYS